MATKIRRSVFVGLGGTGMTSLLHTKKMFIETYGEVPPMVAFLGIDTDGGVYDKELDSTKGKISLSPAEQFPIKVNVDPKPVYKNNSDAFDWFPEENLQFLRSMTLGAGQLRTNGRFAITYNENNVKNKIQQVFDQVLSAQGLGGKYEPLSSAVEIHVVFSVCGGTGCGTFLNIAYLIKELCQPGWKVNGYAVLPDVFRAMRQGAPMEKVKANAYGAICDLDYMMHLDMGQNAMPIKYFNRTYETNEAPFNVVYFIDNKNKQSDSFNNVDDLAEMIGISLITSTGELSIATKSISDNVEKVIIAGNMNVENKRAWAVGMGMCEISFKGDLLKEIYIYKAIQRLINEMRNSCEDANAIADNWIDTVAIRENQGKDQLIDYIASKNPKVTFSTIETPENAKIDYDIYLNNLALPKSSEIDRKISAKKIEVLGGLDELVKKIINEQCGVETINNVINAIQKEIELCDGEMRAELELFKNQETQIQAALDGHVEELKTIMGKMFKSGKDATQQIIIDATNQMATNKREQLRRETAIIFYNWLRNELYNKSQVISNIKQSLDAVYKRCGDAVVECQNKIRNNSSIFRINLDSEYVTKVKCEDGEVVFNDFVKSLSGNKIYDFKERDSIAIQDVLYQYAKTIIPTNHFSKMSVNDALIKIKNDNPELFDNILNDVIRKSEPLLRYDYKGYVPQSPAEEEFYVGVENARNSVLKNNDMLKNKIQGTAQIDFSSVGIKDRIVVFRQIGVFPAYAIQSISDCELEYNQKRDNTNFHWGKNIEIQMDRVEYSLMPKTKEDDSIELWVKGFIFGLIKNENGKYYYKSEVDGDILFDNWVELKEYRDDSFAMFKSRKSTIRKEFNQYIDNFEKTRGSEDLSLLLNRVRQSYWENYSQINIDRAKLKEKGYEGIAELMRKELRYISTEL